MYNAAMDFLCPTERKKNMKRSPLFVSLFMFAAVMTLSIILTGCSDNKKTKPAPAPAEAVKVEASAVKESPAVEKPGSEKPKDHPAH